MKVHHHVYKNVFVDWPEGVSAMFVYWGYHMFSHQAAGCTQSQGQMIYCPDWWEKNRLNWQQIQQQKMLNKVTTQISKKYRHVSQTTKTNRLLKTKNQTSSNIIFRKLPRFWDSHLSSLETFLCQLSPGWWGHIRLPPPAWLCFNRCRWQSVLRRY